MARNSRIERRKASRARNGPNYVSGKLVYFFDASALCDAKVCLLDQPRERERLGVNAREIVRARYDLKTVCLPSQLSWIEGSCYVR